MRPGQAAKVIGCAPAHVRLMIRTGKIKAIRKPLINDLGTVFGYQYDIPDEEVVRIKDNPYNTGRPRGTSRRNGYDHQAPEAID